MRPTGRNTLFVDTNDNHFPVEFKACFDSDTADEMSVESEYLYLSFPYCSTVRFFGPLAFPCSRAPVTCTEYIVRLPGTIVL